ncbi:unnamed protein product, partial [Dibothriocephalus latus]
MPIRPFQASVLPRNSSQNNGTAPYTSSYPSAAAAATTTASTD